MDTVYYMTIAPDFTPDRISGWYIFNTWLQRNLGLRIRLELYDNFEAERAAIHADRMDIVYGNPFDASILVREKGFRAVVRPQGKTDECVVAVSANSPVQRVEDLAPGVRVMSIEDPAIHLIGMMMLESADLNDSNVRSLNAADYVLVAKALLNGEADVGFFLKEAWDGFSNVVRKQLRPLVTSQIFDARHALLVGPRLFDSVEKIRDLLVHMGEIEKGSDALEALGFQGWEAVDQEEAEFMIDLMDALKSK